MVGKPQKRTNETRQKILGAAQKLFDKNGFENTSVDEVAIKAGVVKGTIFSHFGDKKSLLIAIKLQILIDLRNDQNSSLEKNANFDLSKKLMSLYRPWLHFFRENPDFAHLFMVQSTLKSGVWTDEFVKLCGGFEQIIHDTLQSHNPNSTDLDLDTQAMQAFYFHVLALYKGGYIKSPVEQEALLSRLVSKWLIN